MLYININYLFDHTKHRNMGITNETTSLTGINGKMPNNVYKFNIEYLRMFGLLAGSKLRYCMQCDTPIFFINNLRIHTFLNHSVCFVPSIVVMLFAGKATTILFNQYPVTDEPLNSAWKILFKGAESNFNEKKTYIWYTFHYIHTCVFIDNNPAKTVAAFFIQFAMIPLSIFSFLSYKRINLEMAPEFDKLKACSLPIFVFLFSTFSYFFLCLVNSPTQEEKLFHTPRARTEFELHYIPYMLFQLAEMLMSLQQVKYLEAKGGKMPFDFITQPMITVYFWFMLTLYLVYCAFLWSHILFGYGHGLWNSDPDESPIGHVATSFIMYGYIVVADIMPAIFAYKDAQNTPDMKIEFSMALKYVIFFGV